MIALKDVIFVKACIYTLGCKVNAYESEYVRSILEDKGYEIVDFGALSDVVIINTCSVTNNSDSKSRKMINQAIKNYPESCIVACGCFIEANHDIEIENVDNLVIVNKYYKLSKDYEPELVKISSKYAINDRQLLTTDAKEAFEKMCEDARKDNIYLYSGSAYRSYSYQNTLYNNRVRTDGLEYANRTAAKAGYSEHQTGLAIDVLNGKFNYLDSDDKEYEWLVENGYKYGFILRYPKGKEKITGYSYEPWHFRYLTVEVATILKEKNITYEEYIGMNL